MTKSITKRLHHSLRLAFPLSTLLSLSACLFSGPNMVFYNCNQPRSKGQSILKRRTANR